jgi:hypothetical protein
LSRDAYVYFHTEYHALTAGPEMLGNLGYHLWFVGFLFVFALISLPIFLWLRRDVGRRTIASVARLARVQGGLLAFVVPLTAIRLILEPYFPGYTGWTDFAVLLFFFISGYVLMADEQFMRAIHRDGLLYLILGIVCSLFLLSVAAGVPVLDWMGSPGTPAFYLTWAVFTINSWSWTMVAFNAGMRFLNFTNGLLQYCREASFPFFWVHNPVTFFVAFYVVQWEANLAVKMLIVVIGSLAVSLGIYELLVRRINPVRAFFGLRPRTR